MHSVVQLYNPKEKAVYNLYIDKMLDDQKELCVYIVNCVREIERRDGTWLVCDYSIGQKKRCVGSVDLRVLVN